MDSIHRIAVIKNKSDQNITVLFQSADSINDKTLFYGGKVTVFADSISTLYSMAYNFKKMNFFIFDNDSVYNNINHGNINGIVKKSFLEKITISADSLKKNDVIIYKGN